MGMMDEGLTNPGHYSMPLGKNGKKINVFEYATATRRAGVQWHPGNRPIVESNGHAGSLVN